MPRNIRNFWLKASIDGRDTELRGGPVRKDGGMSIKLMQRTAGDITTAVTIQCFATNDGVLVTRIYDADGKVVAEHATVR